MTDDWVIIELNPRGDGEDPDILVRSIQHVLGKTAEIFVPALISQVAEEKLVKYLWEGYLFVRRTFPDAHYFRLEGTRFVERILTQPGPGRERRLSIITSREVDKLRKQIKAETDQGILKGDLVKVTSGPYKGISCRVIEEVGDSVQVQILLRSKEAIITLPRSFLHFVEHSQAAIPMTVSREARLAKWRAWRNQVNRLLSWPQNVMDAPKDAYHRWAVLNRWVTQGAALEEYIRGSYTPLPLQEVIAKHAEWANLALWVAKRKFLKKAEVILAYKIQSYSEAKHKKAEWVSLNRILQRMEDLSASVVRLERTLDAIKDPDMVQNVVIDGFNLAFRCLHADKRGLADSSGRPTGVLFGVLQSLKSTLKKNPQATLYVVWDGGRDRRATIFPEYKGNRKTHTEDMPQVEVLKEVLQLLGVQQLYQKGEEADDLIASLVRGPLAGQQNLIISTDRDFLQLVTDTDTLLCPRPQSKNDPRTELLFNPSEVVGLYGIEPSRIVQLRALLGDPSDNIPGVPRVSDKLLTALLQQYKSVEGIFKSSFAGLTAKQYETIRNFEEQARLNITLMTLKSDLPCNGIQPAPDRPEAERRLREYDIKTEGLEIFFRSN